MCNTFEHQVLDTVLLDAPGLIGIVPDRLLRLMRDHRYGNMCCRIEADDGPAQLKTHPASGVPMLAWDPERNSKTAQAVTLVKAWLCGSDFDGVPYFDSHYERLYWQEK